MTKAATLVASDIADAEAGELEWSDIRMSLLLEAMMDDGFPITADQLQRIVDARSEFTIGTSRYIKVDADNGRATFQDGDWSALHFMMRDDVVYVTESHPY